MIDCMIASVAHRHNASLLASDADLRRVAQVIGVPLGQRSLVAAQRAWWDWQARPADHYASLDVGLASIGAAVGDEVVSGGVELVGP